MPIEKTLFLIFERMQESGTDRHPYENFFDTQSHLSFTLLSNRVLWDRLKCKKYGVYMGGNE